MNPTATPLCTSDSEQELIQYYLDRVAPQAIRTLVDAGVRNLLRVKHKYEDLRNIPDSAFYACKVGMDSFNVFIEFETDSSGVYKKVSEIDFKTMLRRLHTHLQTPASDLPDFLRNDASIPTSGGGHDR
jgi:hypothetical protein